MTVQELQRVLKGFDDNEEVQFYFLKDHNLINCQPETIISTEIGCEITIQETIIEEQRNE